MEEILQFKAENPALYAKLQAEATKSERERAAAHITMGEAYGAMDIALKAIADGSDMTTLITAEYFAAGAKKSASAARAEDDKEIVIEEPASKDLDPDKEKKEKEAAAGMDIMKAAAASMGFSL